MKDIIAELCERARQDKTRYLELTGEAYPKRSLEPKNKSLVDYHRGRISAYEDAVKVIKYGSPMHPVVELLRWRAMERAHYEAGRKGGMQNPSKPKVPVRTVEYYIGRECAFTEAVTLLERSNCQQGALCNSN